MTNLVTRPGKGTSIPRPDLTIKPDQLAKTVALGQRLYENKYGATGAIVLAQMAVRSDRHSIGRVQIEWNLGLSWLRNPQAMNAETRMPALGLSDADAKAVTLYLTTLKGENLRTRPRPQLSSARGTG